MVTENLNQVRENIKAAQISAAAKGYPVAYDRTSSEK